MKKFIWFKDVNGYRLLEGMGSSEVYIKDGIMQYAINSEDDFEEVAVGTEYSDEPFIDTVNHLGMDGLHFIFNVTSTDFGTNYIVDVVETKKRWSRRDSTWFISGNIDRNVFTDKLTAETFTVEMQLKGYGDIAHVKSFVEWFLEKPRVAKMSEQHS